MKHPLAAEAWAAAARVGAAVHQTPVQASAWLSRAVGAPAFLKLETQQVCPCLVLPESRAYQARYCWRLAGHRLL